MSEEKSSPFPQVRRKERESSNEEALKLLSTQNYGVLSLCGANGYGYGVPMNYAFDGHNSLYFHCASEGFKIDSLRLNNKVSFCVIGEHEVNFKSLTTSYSSVIAFGILEELISAEDKRKGLSCFIESVVSELPEKAKTSMLTNSLQKVTILRLNIEHLTMKAHIIKPKADEDSKEEDNLTLESFMKKNEKDES
ncbi:putative 5-nitroimidazole antibiotic resistance protein NimB [Monocercomonoides exilis]|uniref:putative 5-nitroimidazole antibiotic resistance protein NimB n=1 Tax=Monocercomonoides exilis TaxID=2049356 RepID=UPI0035596847|nr:putative 5-nitroimidazole antibiotic resistance protein NimB [Monocercomonoides exilis]|eukprot:MONOS_1556.1-p1 / transcript=MONOS_1556.1 / gene=MONOS_1556 / organism=Monocercomonoides_exilis_PA203 / gene_product=5-nitroimidazole antibiotic resistance protein NimB / transcript_product=5-nitroimidazole antibiotic resistance protein NimB / location=Mono_scaffold00028:22536-23117(-) / protein_length=193 / sequence_SO=supercontig / SO=protein_coding / is_pseudo=false